MAAISSAGGQSASDGDAAKGVALFISHHIETHKEAAERIREILESRSERLEVETCETIIGGENWLQWIKDKVDQSFLMLVLVPECKSDCLWIDKEVQMYFADKKERQRHLLVVTPETRSIPEFAQNIQVIRTAEDFRVRFLEPLYRTQRFTDLHIRPLNQKISADAIRRDAEEIFEVVTGVRTHQDYGESLTVDVTRCSKNAENELDMTNAKVTPSTGWGRILNWDRATVSWKEVWEYAAKFPRKGTFWVKEMEEVMNRVAQYEQPPIMSATFRGHGENAGKIFRAVLARTERIGERTVRFRFNFYEVLRPEFVRDSDRKGDVFGLLYLIGRVRWEVLNPFVDHPYFRDGRLGAESRLDPDEEKELMGRVINSLRVIEVEAERQGTLAKGISAFCDSDDCESIKQMFARREAIKEAIEKTAEENDYKQLIVELKRSLDLNSRAMQIVAREFARLVEEDRERVKLDLAVNNTAVQNPAAGTLTAKKVSVDGKSPSRQKPI
jgi:hypothetical protein